MEESRSDRPEGSRGDPSATDRHPLFEPFCSIQWEIHLDIEKVIRWPAG
jgi:hypothetical protein